MSKATDVKPWVGVAVVTLGVIALGGILWGSNSDFKPDGAMAPRTAVQLGLLDESEAPWSSSLKFRKAEGGGYEYRIGSKLLIVSIPGATRHTTIDLAAECHRLGGCSIIIPSPQSKG
ncbi:hypothetical protein [Achromobacter spanius]|uniref:hypothetical protein n=1 Tax=Achromobacter spanius TaxID=217203 RepID=UPI00381A955A